MEKNNKRLRDEYARATFFLPVEKENELEAVNEIILYLKTQDPKSITDYPITGFTHSNLFPAVFIGNWYNEKKNDFDEEYVVQFIIDYHIPFNKHTVLTRRIEELRTQIRIAYEKHGSPQEELWITIQQIFL